MYDYLIVGAGLFGATLADLLTKSGKSVLVVENKQFVGGTVYTDVEEGIIVHRYGAHIFRTDDVDVWNYVTSFGEFNNFINTPISIHNHQAYNLPFNMNTFAKLWGITTPDEAEKIIKEQTSKYKSSTPSNLEEHALSTVGPDIYYSFIKEYTEKQWDKPCSDLPVSVMRRIPIRLTYNNNYYTSKYQGIPLEGYTPIIQKMLAKSDVLLGVDGKQFIYSNPDIARQIIYTGRIDTFFDYKFGELEYRSLHFEHKTFDVSNRQGIAVINWADKSVPYTRTIEHKHFINTASDKTIVSYEYPVKCDGNNEAYYPINTTENNVKYTKYRDSNSTGIIFAGRLGKYEYTDMQDTIKNAFDLSKILLKEDR